MEDDSEKVELSLEIIVDPQADDSIRSEIENLAIDKITWMSIINSSLTKLYGISGSCLPYTITGENGRSAVLQIDPRDRDKFESSLFACTFNLNQYYSTIEANCTIRSSNSAE
ncbi:hypothetical protein JA9_004674 [Meyerozyma sp. JA9]|nr:hypothetical protein JA9_004674 [Meyerozyma sp. JA9]